MTALEFIKFFVNMGILYEQAFIIGDYKASNKLYDKEMKIFKQLENNIELANQVLPILLDEKYSKYTRISAATHCLALGFNKKEAVKTLKQIKKIKIDPTFAAFAAEIALKKWRWRRRRFWKYNIYKGISGTENIGSREDEIEE